ncbi:hypothetical protein B0H67DRAFT_582347 [Lasiosphaeris hirsuta]|uniref:Uncharacterized protein n=1 Tax=Lasiosphaeris hirsuta TaxID=260670 RepID=A0AA40AHS7_9PEZI|nr:hypothetical protein B0H67DRAFT_582347 [Lasiosphaeris hirsuta]
MELLPSGDALPVRPPVTGRGYPAAIPSEVATSISREEPIPGSAQRDPHVFGIEMGFWKIHHSAQELLKFAAIYSQHQDTGSSTGQSRGAALPKEIDILSMIQLSWSVLHAATDINNHAQRIDARKDVTWRRSHRGQGGPSPQLWKRPRHNKLVRK